MWHKGLITIELNGNFGNITRIDRAEQWKGFITKLRRDKEFLEEEEEHLANQVEEDLKVIQKIKELEKPEPEAGEKLLHLEEMLKLKREKLRTARNILKDWDKYRVFKLETRKTEIKEIFIGDLKEIIHDSKYQQDQSKQ